MAKQKQHQTTKTQPGFLDALLTPEIQYVLLFCALLVLWLTAQVVNIRFYMELGPMLETSSAVIAFAVGGITLARFFTKRNNTLLFVALGFLGVGFIDGYNALLEAGIPLNVHLLSGLSCSWVWLASRTVLGTMLFLSWFSHVTEKNLGAGGYINELVVVLFSVSLMVGLLFIFSYIGVGSSYNDTVFQQRVWETIPALMFGLALVGYLLKGNWKKKEFDHWLVMSLMMGVVLQVLFFGFTASPYDDFYIAGHVLKQLSYLAVFIGSVFSIHDVYKKSENVEEALTRQNVELIGVKEELQELLEQYKEKDVELKGLLNETATEKAKDEAMLNSLGDALVVADEDTRIVRTNKSFEEMIGYSLKEVTGKPVGKMLRMVDRSGNRIVYEELPQIVALFAGQKVSHAMKYYYERKDGSRFPVAVTATPIIVQKKTVGVIQVFRDMSKEKEIDEAKTAFVSVASHQLRTPLTTINWYLEMLLSGDLGKLEKQQKKYIKDVYEASTRLAILVDDLLNVSRIESGRLRFEPEPTDMIQLLQDNIQAVERLAEGAGVKIELRTPKNKKLDEIPVDVSLYSQVIHNLLTNAIRYSPYNEDATVTVELKLKVVRKAGSNKHLFKPGTYVVVSVSDQGIGIPKEARKHLFEKFYRADNAVQRATEGSGLGLYLARMIMDQAGGALWYTSVTKKGTTFYVAIPLSGMLKRAGDKTLSKH